MNTLIKSSTILAVAVAVLISGCAGRTPNPVMVNQLGDNQKSCTTLQTEMHMAESEIQRLMPQSNKTGKNVALGVTGILFFPAWFFMDLSEAEKTEVEAYRQRHNRLHILAVAKKCDFLQVSSESTPQTEK